MVNKSKALVVKLVIVVNSEFPIVSSSSSTLEEPVLVSEEPKEYNAKIDSLFSND